MPVNLDYQGREYPPEGSYVVSRAKIREFAEAVGATDPVHTDVQVARERGYADVIAPPTFAVLISQLSHGRYIRDPEAGVDFSRVVHGEERFVHARPLVAGDEVLTTSHVDSIREAGGHSMITTRDELRTPDGELVCTVTSVIVVRGEH